MMYKESKPIQIKINLRGVSLVLMLSAKSNFNM